MASRSRGEATPTKTAPDPSAVASASAGTLGHGARKRWWIDWATLLRRVYDVDALACPCGGRLRFVEVIDDTADAGIALRTLGLPAEPPVVAPARARDPTLDFDPSQIDWGIDATPTEQVDPPPPDTW